MIARTEYIHELNKWRDQPVIKVVTGLRRCGKSTLLRLYQEELRAGGVSDQRILSLNFEDFANEELLDCKALYQHILSRLHPTETTYIFLDEVQMVPDFQKAVDSLALRPNVDLYVTGSNAFLLSGELATLLSGRYVEISMLPLSFAEYAQAKGRSDDAAFADYLRWGGLPYVALLSDPAEQADAYLEGIYNTVVVKDIDLRQARRESGRDQRRVTDITLLRNIARFLAASVGSPVSVKSIADYITSAGRKVSQTTVGDYVAALVEPYIFYPAERFDVMGKQLLKQNQKLYIVDLGLRRHLLSRREYDLGYSLENTVFLELRRRGYQVNVGKAGSAEIDFIARKRDRLHYYQVSASLTDKTTFDREIAPLQSLRDNYPKTILTLDRFTPGDYAGIEVINAVDWLLRREETP